jgi:hypothetical protein
MTDPYTLVLDFTRAKDAGETFKFRMVTQSYHRRLADRTTSDPAELPWDEGLSAAIEALRDPEPDPEILQRIGNILRRFLNGTGWSSEERALTDAIDRERPVILTIRSGAAELYALPWELLALGHSTRHLDEIPGVLVRYEWPGIPARAEQPAPRPEGGRVFLALSHAGGGGVPEPEHLAGA